MTKLDRLLEGIDPSKTYDDAERRAGEALVRFEAPPAVIENWHVFRSVMARLRHHLNGAILGAASSRRINHEMEWFGCQKILFEEFGSSGDKAAFELARTGNENGLHGVIQRVARRMAQDAAENWVAVAVSSYIGHLTPDERLLAPREYIAKHGHLLPSELTEDSAARVIMEFPKYLEEHPRLLRKLRHVTSPPGKFTPPSPFR